MKRIGIIVGIASLIVLCTLLALGIVRFDPISDYIKSNASEEEAPTLLVVETIEIAEPVLEVEVTSTMTPTPQLRVGDMEIEISMVTPTPILKLTSTPTPTSIEVAQENIDASSSEEGMQNNETYIDEANGDIDNTVTVAKADKIFLDYASLLANDFPINKVDFILADVSEPLIKIYGNTDHVYAMYDYEHSKTKTTFNIRADDDKVYKVTIKYENSEFIVTVKAK